MLASHRAATPAPHTHPRRNRLTNAESRAEAAELAKIELSLKLADLAASAELAEAADVDGRSSLAPPPRRAPASQQGGEGGGEGEGEGLPASYSVGEGLGGSDEAASELELLQRRVETAELAAAAANRRAAVAEAQVDKLKVRPGTGVWVGWLHFDTAGWWGLAALT